MKKGIVAIGIIAFIICANNVSAKEIYYTNKNNVSFTKEEYQFLTKLYWEGCQELFDEKSYQKFVDSNIINAKVETKIVDDLYRPYGTSFSSSSKSLKIAKACSNNCLISVTATWAAEPTIKSYDVIGTYLDKTSLVNTPVTTATTGDDKISSKEIQKFSNGFGVSIKLPSKITEYLIINQTFRVNLGGHVYASYQHAMQNISLANSKKYTIARGGYGGVFKFSGVAAETYDKFTGVDIEV